MLSSTHSARASLLHLPSHLRIIAYQHSNHRSFSASAARNTSLVDVAVAGPTAVIDAIHDLGLPWYAALPTAAVLVRGVLVYYLHTRPVRRAAQIRSNLVPLISADFTTWPKAPSTRLRNAPQDIQRAVEKLQITISRNTHFITQMQQKGKLFGAPVWHARGVINFAALIAFTEAIREKCSSGEGLLPVLLRPLQWVARQVFPGSFPQPPPKPTLSLEEKVAQRIEQLQEQGHLPIGPNGEPIVDPRAILTSMQADKPELGPHFDPSLQSEGLSWCPDLTLADSTGILPIALAVTLAANTVLRPIVGRSSINSASKTPLTASDLPPDLDPDSPDVRRFLQLNRPRDTFQWNLRTLTTSQRIGLGLSVAFGFVAMQMPAAILLYFVPSVAIGWLQGRWLDWKMPIHPPIQRCSRPLRYRVRKEWVDS